MPDQSGPSKDPELTAATGLTYRDPPPKLDKKLRRLVDEYGRGAVTATLQGIGGPWNQREYEEIADGRG